MGAREGGRGVQARSRGSHTYCPSAPVPSHGVHSCLPPLPVSLTTHEAENPPSVSGSSPAVTPFQRQPVILWLRSFLTAFSLSSHGTPPPPPPFCVPFFLKTNPQSLPQASVSKRMLCIKATERAPIIPGVNE